MLCFCLLVFVFVFFFLIIQSQAAFVNCLDVARFTIVHSKNTNKVSIIIIISSLPFSKGLKPYERSYRRNALKPHIHTETHRNITKSTLPGRPFTSSVSPGPGVPCDYLSLISPFTSSLSCDPCLWETPETH